MIEQSSQELLNYIERRVASQAGHDDPLTRGYLLALRHVREHVENKEKYESDEKVDS